ncbi:hypothetical protein [Synechococcus sp. UW140]|uniref:hypothetical protein n=1 Tax=Synechococcus sp. UW140 TaxID=368503 RepID=UPI0010BD66CF|nr:hypothetical protein [Synechococcus sp. UW140]
MARRVDAVSQGLAYSVKPLWGQSDGMVFSVHIENHSQCCVVALIWLTFADSGCINRNVGDLISC